MTQPVTHSFFFPNRNRQALEVARKTWATWGPDEAIWNTVQDFHHKYHITSVSISFSFLFSHAIGWHYLNSIKAYIWFMRNKQSLAVNKEHQQSHMMNQRHSLRDSTAQEKLGSLLCSTCFVELKSLLTLTWDFAAKFMLSHHWSQLAKEKPSRSEPNKAWTGARTCREQTKFMDLVQVWDSCCSPRSRRPAKAEEDILWIITTTFGKPKEENIRVRRPARSQAP